MATADDVTVHEGLTYAEREAGAMKLDLYLPDTEAPPLVVYVHGGGWVAETRKNVPDPERFAAAFDCAIASVSYRLQEAPDGTDPEEMYDPENPTPRGKFPDHFVDVKASIRWLRAHAGEYGYDAEDIAVWGASAGGHLAMLAAVVEDIDDFGSAFGDLEKSVAPDESGAVQALVSWYGASDFSLAADGEDGLIPMLMGGPEFEYPERYAQASPVEHVSPDSPPALLMHGREDEVVSVEQSRRFFDALDEAGVDATLYELHDMNHVWVETVEEIDSERTAMDLLTVEPRPAQSLYETSHSETGELRTLVDGKPPAGPEPIKQFLNRTIN